LVLVIGLLITNTLQASRKTSFEQKNNLTEKNNEQYQLQQKEIQEQQQRIAEQERLELERAAQAEKENITNRIIEIKNSLTVNYSNLKIAKSELNDAADFQFLRSPDQRIEDIDLAQNNIAYLKNDIATLEKELDLLYLKLEKIR
jgi:transcription initiation factor IIF auxiliary subunit